MAEGSQIPPSYATRFMSARLAVALYGWIPYFATWQYPGVGSVKFELFPPSLLRTWNSAAAGNPGRSGSGRRLRMADRGCFYFTSRRRTVVDSGSPQSQESARYIDRSQSSGIYASLISGNFRARPPPFPGVARCAALGVMATARPW